MHTVCFRSDQWDPLSALMAACFSRLFSEIERSVSVAHWEDSVRAENPDVFACVSLRFHVCVVFSKLLTFLAANTFSSVFPFSSISCGCCSVKNFLTDRKIRFRDKMNVDFSQR